MEGFEFSHWLLGILREQNSRSALRAALAGIRVWLQKLCNSLFLPRSACLTRLRLQFYTDRCRVYGQKFTCLSTAASKNACKKLPSPQVPIGVCTPCMHGPTGRHNNVRGPQVYKGCWSSFKRRTMISVSYESMRAKRSRSLTNVKKYGSQVIYAYTHAPKPKGGSLQEDQSRSDVSS